MPVVYLRCDEPDEPGGPTLACLSVACSLAHSQRLNPIELPSKLRSIPVAFGVLPNAAKSAKLLTFQAPQTCP